MRSVSSGCFLRHLRSEFLSQARYSIHSEIHYSVQVLPIPEFPRGAFQYAWLRIGGSYGLEEVLDVLFADAARRHFCRHPRRPTTRRYNGCAMLSIRDSHQSTGDFGRWALKLRIAICPAFLRFHLGGRAGHVRARLDEPSLLPISSGRDATSHMPLRIRPSKY